MEKMVFLEVQIHLFPFQKVPRGSDIILYGYGVYGRQYAEQIRKSNYCNIQYIVDRNWETIQSDIPVYDPERLKSETNPIVVITTGKYEKEIRKWLYEIGIREENVISCEIIMDALSQEAIGVDEQTATQLEKFRKLVSIRKAEGIDLVRVGKDNDGGYLMLDHFGDGKVAYSFGISRDVSWDRDMAARGYDVLMYDHTINGLPEENERFHWSKIGVEGRKSYRADLDTLTNLIRKNGHDGEKNMILKMDVEGAEWECFEETSSRVFAQFDQIALELHRILNFNKLERMIACLEKLNQTHQCVHIHMNNYSARAYLDNVPYVDCIEVTFANRGNYRFQKCDSSLPHPLDQGCNPLRREIVLGTSYND